jgi:hypothetical protein
MERWGSWFRGRACPGVSDSSGDADKALGECDADDGDASLPNASRIVYPLAVDAWNAVGEHLFEEQECGVAVRYARGQDRDRWIDVYFYPAGILSGDEFDDAARLEADLIRQAHEAAGYAGFEMGPPGRFSIDPMGGDATVEAIALDLQYDADGTAYSSAMVLLLHDLYFVKARYSVARATLTRAQTRNALEAFVAQLRSQLTIASVGAGWGDGVAFADRRKPGSSLREIRLDYGDAPADAIATSRHTRKDVLVA